MRKITFFTAPYCGACKLVQPTVKAIAETHGAEFIEINNDNNEHVPAGIVFLPTIDVENQNGEITRFEGVGMIKNAGTLEAALGVDNVQFVPRFFNYMDDYFENIIEIDENGMPQNVTYDDTFVNRLEWWKWLILAVSIALIVYFFMKLYKDVKNS